MASTAAPSGVTVTRSGDNYTISWKQGTSYSTQSIFAQRKGLGKNYVNGLGGDRTSYVWTIPKNGYYPIGTLLAAPAIVFGVKGLRNGTWSAEASREFTVTPPLKPTVRAELSSQSENVVTFSYSIDWTGKNIDKNTTGAMFTNFQWWSTILPNSNLKPEEVTDWTETGINDNDLDSTSKQFTETVVLSDNYSYTRYFKVVARGPGGDSEPAYAKYVYAIPYAPNIYEATAVKLRTGVGARVAVTWAAEETNARPIDDIYVEYAIETPVASHTDVNGVRKVTLSVPSIQSWTTVSIRKDATKERGTIDGTTFIIDQEIPPDKWIFVRVVAKHDNRLSPSKTIFVKNGWKGSSSIIDELIWGLQPWDTPDEDNGTSYSNILSDPSGLSATINGNIATITVNNNSAVTESIVGIYYRSNVRHYPQLVGVKPAGSSAPVYVILPDEETDEISLGAEAILADYSPIVPYATGVTSYAITNVQAKSSGIVWDDRAVPKPPSDISLSSPRSGVVRITWDWTWTEANGVELSWADHEDAWESTDGPTTHEIDDRIVNAWNISGLSVGVWYFRIRLYKIDKDAVTYGTYSDIKTFKLVSSPATPVLTITPSIVPPDGTVTCYWAFTAIDGDEQIQADICEATINGDTVTYGDVIAQANDEQFKTLNVTDLGWTAGSKHYLSVRIVTMSGEQTDNWSIPKPVQILEKPTSSIDSTSLRTITVVDDEEQEITHQQLSLTEMPLTVSASGAGESGSVTYILERSGDYNLYRPDDNEYTGFDGETIAIVKKSATNAEGESADYTVSITLDDLLGALDDGAYYNLIAIVQDSYGQTAQASLNFAVHWDHQAVVPSAEITIDNEEMVAFITPTIPATGYEDGDVCDIYRLSADKPELIIKNAELGTKYVDPYPALGDQGGHRIVYKTANGDYITESNQFAWTDYGYDDGDVIDRFATVIDFGDNQAIFPYDLSLSSRWSKDFTQTKYLGGSIEGDWNPTVERTATVKTRVAVKEDSDLIYAMRRLATYSGICHVRTPDGSSFSANIDVSEDREEKKINMIASFSLDIRRVDTVGFDGVPYDSWATS